MSGRGVQIFRLSLQIETIPRSSNESFRVLRRRDNLKEVEHCEGSVSATPVEGVGERWHLHKEMELTFIERGEGVRVVGDNVAPFSSPELVLLGSDLPHCWHGLRHSTGCAVQFHWSLDHPLRSLPGATLLGDLWHRAARGILFSPVVANRVGARMTELGNCEPLSRMGLFLQILGEISATAPTDMKPLSRTEFGLAGGLRHEAAIAQVVRHVLENYADPQPLEQVLRRAGMSKATFARQFPRFTGSTFTQF